MIDPDIGKLDNDLVQQLRNWYDAGFINGDSLSQSQAALIMATIQKLDYIFDIGKRFEQLLKTGKCKQLCRDALMENCDDHECMICGIALCPHGKPLHFHHDGCPACNIAVKNRSADDPHGVGDIMT